MSSSHRHLARVVVLQVLYEYDMRLSSNDPDLDLDEIIVRSMQLYPDINTKDKFASKYAREVVKNIDRYIELLQPIAPDWPLDQIAKIDKVVILMGAHELLDLPDIPPKVTLNECVELAKMFGNDSSSKFVNGVLGTLLREHAAHKMTKDMKDSKDNNENTKEEPQL
jgi:transcription antitermination protein NusB